MKRKSLERLGLLALFSAAFPVSALNPIHDASAEFSPPIGKPARPVLMLGGYYTDQSSQKIRALFSYLQPLTPDFQIGFGAQTRWLDEPNNVRHLLLGAKFQPALPWSVQLDAMLGVANYAGDGITVTGNYRFEPFPMLPIRAMVRAGMLDALVWDPDFTVLAGSLVPQWKAHEKFRVELEVFAATQFPGVHDYFGLDFGPALAFNLWESWWVRAGALFGAAGPNQAEPRFALVQQIGI